MSVSDPRVCPHCDSDTYFAQNFPRIRDELARMREEFKRQAARHAVEVAKWQLNEIEREEQYRFVQQKVHKQRLVINRLETKLRKLKVVPHEVDNREGAA